MTTNWFHQNILENFKFQPTLDQQKLFAKLGEFTFNSSSRIALVVRGYAGTGKTTAMSAYIQSVGRAGWKVKILAPTGRAAKVISLASGQDAFTIHKQIYRRKSKADLNSPISLNKNLFKRTIFIIDEASMISDYSISNNGNVNERNLLEDLFEYVYSGDSCKLILMGDEGQLPPVGSDFSPALNLDYLKNNFALIEFEGIRMSEVQRQAEDSFILKNATQLRSIENMSDLRFESNNLDFIRVEGGELQEELESSISDFGIEGSIVITRSNKRANLFNQQIRGRILWYEELLCNGDCLMVVKNNYFWISEDSKMGFVANGEMIKIKRIIKYEEYYGFEFARVNVVFVDYEEEGEVEIIIMLETLLAEGPSISRERMRELFFEVEKDYSHIRVKKDRYEKIISNPYFNALQVKYAYAVTCHKSQGGQWPNVFIDVGFVPVEQQDKNFFRWLYTAITRASEKVYLVNFEDKFFSS